MTVKIHSIQVMRALAATAVVIAHLLQRTDTWWKYDVWALTDLLGEAGVALFFVISGFIMVEMSWTKFGSPGASQNFMWRRITRIAPVYIVFTLCIVTLQVRNLPQPSELLSSIFFWPYYNEAHKIRPVLGPGWTLNYEMFFYALFAASLFLTRRIALGAMFAGLIGLVGLGLYFRSIGPISARTDVWTSAFLLLFAAGMAIAAFRNSVSTNFRTGRPVTIGLATMGAALLSYAALGFPSGSNELTATGQGLLGHLPLWLCCAIIVAICAFEKGASGGPVSRLFERMGDASYSIYLSHILTLIVVKKIWLNAIGPSVAYIPFALISAIAAGFAAHYWLEKPIMRILKSRQKTFQPA